MTDHEKTRERLETEIHDAIESIHGTIEMYDVDVEYPEPTGDTEITIPSVEYTAGKTADAVIAHLWRMADDPEVVDVMLGAFNDASAYAMDQAELMQAVMAAGLTAMIGPNPEGDTDER